MLSFRKRISLLIAICLAFSIILAGCSGGKQTDTTAKDDGKAAQDSSGSSDQTSVDKKPEEEPPQVELEPVTLKWVLLGSKQQDSEMVWEEWNKKLQQDYLPNTTVEFEAIPASEFKEKWGLMMAAGEQVDIAWTGYALTFEEEIAKGSYLPLNDLIKNHAPDILQELPQWILDLGSMDGVIYAVPNYQQMTELRIGMRTHKELADKYLDAEQMEKDFYASTTSGQFRHATQATYDIIEEYLRTLKDNNELKLGFSPAIISAINEGISFPGNIKMRLPNRGQEWDFTLYPFYEMPEIKLFNDTLHKWFKEGFIRQDYLALENPREDEGKEDGYIAWFHETFKNTAEKESMRWGFDITVIPLEPDYYISRLNSSTSLAIPRTSVAPERAIKIIELMNTKKGLDLLNMLIWGIEGVHYEMAGDNYVKTLHYDGGQAPADVPYGLPNWSIGNTFVAALNQANPPDYNEYIEGIHESAIKAPFIGFKPDTSPVMTEIAQVSAVMGEFKNIWAYDDYETRWEDMISKLKAAGIDKIREEIQNQLNDYLEKQGIK